MLEPRELSVEALAARAELMNLGDAVDESETQRAKNDERVHEQPPSSQAAACDDAEDLESSNLYAHLDL